MSSNEFDLKKYLKLDPGVRTNRVLYDFLLRPLFLGYWTFQEPAHKGVEIADALLLADDTAILFEAKTRGVPAHASPTWIRQRLKEAVGQLNRGAALLRKETVKLRNKWRGEITIEPGLIRHLYGIVLLVAEFDPFEWRELAETAAKQAKIPVQVFSLHDFSQLLRIFNTPNDLLVYYEIRARFALHSRMLVGEELNTFKEILEHWSELSPEDREQGEKSQRYLLSLGNAILRTTLATETGYRYCAASLLFDFCFRPTDRRADPDLKGRRVGSMQHDEYIATLEAISEIARNRRSFYGEQWVVAAREALANGNLVVRSYYSPMRSRSYSVVASPLGQDPPRAQLVQIARDTLQRHTSKSSLVLGASAASIVSTFDLLLKRCRGEEPPDIDEQLILAPTIAWIGGLRRDAGV